MNPLPHPGCQNRPNSPRNPPGALPVQRPPPTGMALSSSPRTPSPQGGQPRTRRTPRNSAPHGSHTPSTSFPYPNPKISIPGPPGVVLRIPRPRFLQGSLSQRLHLSPLQGSLHLLRSHYLNPQILPHTNLRPLQHKPSTQSPLWLPPAPASAPFLPSRAAGSAPLPRILPPTLTPKPSVSSGPPHSDRTTHLSPSAEDGGAGARPQPRPQIRCLSP